MRGSLAAALLAGTAAAAGAVTVGMTPQRRPADAPDQACARPQANPGDWSRASEKAAAQLRGMRWRYSVVWDRPGRAGLAVDREALRAALRLCGQRAAASGVFVPMAGAVLADDDKAWLRSVDEDARKRRLRQAGLAVPPAVLAVTLAAYAVSRRRT